MRILHVSDLHGNAQWYGWLASVSPSFDLVCVTGDLIDLNSKEPRVRQVDQVIGHLRALRSPFVAVCSGNHDSPLGGAGRLAQARWLEEVCCPNVLTDGDRLEIRGTTIRCIGWNAASLPAARPNEVWLHHAPPDRLGTAITRDGASFGNLDLADLCQTQAGPRLVLSGHVHDPVSWHSHSGRTSSINPGYAKRSSCPNHVVVDLDRQIAIHRSGEGYDEDVKRLNV